MTEAVVPRVERVHRRGGLDEAAWSRVPAVMLRRAQDGADPLQATTVRIAHDVDALLLRFDCDDRDIWATHSRRDAPLWEEEVVELFVAPGEDDPSAYVEIEVNPLGAIFDARVTNPDGRRESMRVDASWDAAGLVAVVLRPSPGTWAAQLEVPWSDLCDGAPPRVWRANFFRIERPRGGEHEFSCWSPTLEDPPDFHRPRFFGRLVLDDLEARA
jgi:cellulose/xylan binding protein with CBM9 domain